MGETTGRTSRTQEHERSNHTQQQSRAPTGLRILCLHDSNSSASCLKDDMSKLGDRLYEKHGIDLVYINSPLCASVSGESDRLWWEARAFPARQSPNGGSHEDSQQEQLIGLDASLLLLQQIWSSMPFWGILVCWSSIDTRRLITIHLLFVFRVGLIITSFVTFSLSKQRELDKALRLLPYYLYFRILNQSQNLLFSFVVRH